MTKKRRRPIHLHVMVSEEEQALIQERMAEAGIRNMGAYMRKMALSGYVLHVSIIRNIFFVPHIIPKPVIIKFFYGIGICDKLLRRNKKIHGENVLLG